MVTWRDVSLFTIPAIMRKIGLKNGARLQEIWFQGQPVRCWDKNYDVLPVETNTIKMDSFVLRFQRARDVYDKLKAEAKQHPEKLFNIKRLEQQIVLNMQAGFGATIPFPPSSVSKQILSGKRLVGKSPQKTVDPWSMAERSVGGRFDPIDDMRASVGEFHFNVIPVGEVVVGRDRSIQFRLKQIATFVVDSFDYTDNFSSSTDSGDRGSLSQILGVWDFDKGAFLRTVTGGAQGWVSGGAHYSPDPAWRKVTGTWLIRNKTFRSFRQKWKRGMDFLVYSDVKVETVGSKTITVRQKH